MNPDIVRCVGCKATMPLSQTSVHDWTCDYHGKHTPKRWTDCTHENPRCYEPVREDEGTAA